MISRKNQTSIIALPFAIIAAVSILLIVYYYRVRYFNYVLIGDEPAFVSATIQQDALQWFKSGYSRYFETFPEWFVPQTNFLRPITNIIVWLEYKIFGEAFGFYFSAYYAAIIAAFFLTYLCLREFTDKIYLYINAALIWVLSPAVVSTGLWTIPFMFDVITAAMTVTAFWCVLHRKYGATFLVLLVSLFTKETALFSPIAAALTVLIIRRPSLATVTIAVSMLIPIAIWCLARLAAFGHIFGGTAKVGLTSILKGLSRWPTGIEGPQALIEALRSGHLLSPMDLFAAASILVSFLVSGTLLIIYVKFGYYFLFKRKFTSSVPVPTASEYLYASLIWFGGALGYVILTGTPGRFGADVYLFLVILLAAVAQQNSKAMVSRLAFVSSIALIVMFLPNAFMSIESSAVEIADQTRLNSSLYASLQGIPQDGRKVLVVNAPSAFSSPRSIVKMEGFKLDVSFLNQFDGCKDSNNEAVETRFDPPSHRLHVVIPSCAKILFLGATLPEFSSGSNVTIGRDGFGRYIFKNIIALRRSILSGDEIYEFGNEFDFEPQKSFSAIIYYDWKDKAYRTLNL